MAKEKILVLTKNWLGDVVFQSAAIKTIKENFPDSELVAAGPERCQEIFRNFPYIDRAIVFDEKKSERPLLEKLKRSLEWRRERFTHAFLFHRSMTRAFLVRLAGVPFRAGYATKGRSWLLTHSAVEPAPGLHDTDYFLSLLKAVGLRAELGRPYEFYFSKRDEDFALRLMESSGLRKNNFFVFHTGANWQPKRWPMERFGKLARLIGARGAWPIVLTGAKEDEGRIDQFLSLTAQLPIISLAGKTSLGELGALFSFSRAVVSNDSGPLHIADGVGAKTVAIFGPTNEVKTGPRGRGESVLLKKMNITDIAPEEVIKALEKLKCL